MRKPFADRIALVTGGASGIGRALAIQLADAGAHVTVADIDRAGAERVTEVLRVGRSIRARACLLDVRDRAAWANAVAELQAHEGRLDFFFNNAGVAVIGNALRMEAQHWDALVDVNIRGVHHGIEAVYPLMAKQGSGHIVNTASMAGLVPAPGLTAYAMTKHAVVGLSTSLRVEAARYGVRVSAVCPGLISTRMTASAQLLGHERRTRGEMPETRRGRHYSPDSCARHILRGVAQNRAVIPVTPAAHIAWRLYRASPALLAPVLRRLAKRLAPLD